MERRVDVRTGEAVAIGYELAGLGSRFLAVVVDGVIQTLLLLAFLIAAGFTLSALGGRGRILPANLDAVVIAFVVAAVFTNTVGYFIVFETWWGGRSPGKRILGLRVIRDGGFTLDFGASVIRNLVRLAEAGMGFYVIAAISALLSPENKRLGDYAAGTIVVRDRPHAPDLDAYLNAAAESPLPPQERLLVERFLARRPTLEAHARGTLAARIAERVRPYAPPDAPRDDEALLESLTR